MNVLMVTGEFPPLQGGVGDYTARLVEALRNLGVGAEVVTGNLPSQPVGFDYPVHQAVSSWGWRCWSSLVRLARARGADLIHIQYQAAAYAMHPAINLFPWFLRLRRMGIPSVATFHDLRVPYLFPKAGPARWWSILALAAGCRAAILTNREDFERLAPYGDWVHRVRIPIGANVIPPAGCTYRVRDGGGTRDVTLVHFGLLNESKGCQDLVEALARLRDGAPGWDFSLRMVGGTVGQSDPTNRAFRERLLAQIARHQLDDRITWTGFLPPGETSLALLDGDLCVLPYRDGASFRRGTLLAALTHGLPIVTTEPAWPTPELRHGENVWLVPVADPDALAKAVLHLAGQPDLRRRLSEGARELGGEFGWDRIARATQEVYRDVAAS